MDSLLGRILIASLAVGGLLYFFFVKLENVADLETRLLQGEVSQRQANKEEKSQNLLEMLALEPRPSLDGAVLRAALDAEPPSYSQDCVDRWSQLLTVDLTQTDLSEIPQTESCESTPALIENARIAFENLCKDLPLPDEVDPKSQEKNHACLRGFVIYRASINATLNASTPLSEIRDGSVLLDLLISAQAHDGESTEIKQIAERLHELEPDLYQPIKVLTAHSLYDLTQNFETLDEEQKQERLRELSETANQAWDYGIDDPSIFETRIIAQTQMMKDPSAAYEMIREARELQVFPHLANYYEALIEESRGNRIRAVELLEAAAVMDPKNSRIKDTLKIYESSPEGLSPLLSPLLRDLGEKPSLSLEFDLSP